MKTGFRRGFGISWAITALAVATACGSDDEGGKGGGGPRPPDPLPALTGSTPAAGETVPRTAWLVLRFDSAPAPDALAGLTLDCGEGTPEHDADRLGESTVVVNPRAELPPGASCTLSWRGTGGEETLGFGVAGEGPPAPVPYDRDDASSMLPFPDDFWLEDDSSTPTGRVVALPTLDRPSDVNSLLGALGASSKSLDGFSPLAPWVVTLDDAPDEASLPTTEAASLDPLATVGLLDGATGARVPFDLLVENHTSADGSEAHDLVVVPSIPLEARGEYVLVVTRRALVDPTRPLEQSRFFARAADPADDRSTDAENRAGEVVQKALDALGRTSPPIRRDDVAVAVHASIRSIDEIPRDLLSIRSQIQAAPAPTFTIDDVRPDSNANVAAVVDGTVTIPSFRDGNFVNRGADGLPEQNGTADIPFVLALPAAAETGPVPMVMYQHGTPGSAEREVPGNARHYLAAAGYAVIGFTDIPNRELTGGTDPNPYAIGIFTTLLSSKRLPDYITVLPTAEQLAFLRFLPELASLDVLPVGAPDGTAELDTAAPLAYLGISQGSFRGTGLVAYAPEIHAAALVAGGGRWSQVLIHQAAGGSFDPIYETVTGFFPSVTWSEYWLGTSLAQMGADDQDELMHARFVYAEPHDLGTDRRPSILATEGLGDSMVAVYSTRTAAHQFGIPQLGPAAETVPFLEQVTGPLRGNIDADTTGAFFQYVPKGYSGADTTPGCESSGETEGHFCAQVAPEAIAQRLHFLDSALTGTPEIVEPGQAR